MSQVQPPSPKGMLVSAPVVDAARGDRPNVLLITVDQWRGDWLGAAGHPLVRTPQLDKLCQQGLLFSNAMSECPVCVPARRILMTGRTPHGIHMFANRDTQPFPEGPKLAALLTASGYTSHAVGKLHTWPPRDRIGFEDVELNEEGRTAGLPQGDDYTRDLVERGLGASIYAHGLGNNQYDHRPTTLDEPLTTTGWTAERSLRWLYRRDPTRPFFLNVSFDKPHPPFTPPKGYFDLYRDRMFPEPAKGDWLDRAPARHEIIARKHSFATWQHRPEEIQDSLRAYAALMTHIDSRIGQILGMLREQQILDNTLVMMVGDHGDNLFDHGVVGKSDFLTGSCRIPFIVVPPPRWGLSPSRLGRVISRVVPGLADVLPTMCEAVNIPIPHGVNGQSLLPFFHDETPAFRQVTGGRCESRYAVCDGQFRYLWDGVTSDIFLFDIIADPLCCHDLSRNPQHLADNQRLHAALTNWAQVNQDERVKDGVLTAMGSGPDLGSAHTINEWNNRGLR